MNAREQTDSPIDRELAALRCRDQVVMKEAIEIACREHQIEKEYGYYGTSRPGYGIKDRFHPDPADILITAERKG